MVEKINNNGFDFVDLGLPSGTLWATKNIGADNSTDFGLYFQWGDVQGYTKKEIGLGKGQKKFAHDFSDYKWYSGGAFTKYKTEGATLELEDDAANVHMGGSWHIPSSEQIQELIDNTTSNWIKMDNVNGRLFTSENDASKFIFIPASGFAWDGSVQGSESHGSVWSSMLDTGFVDGGQSLFFGSGYANIYNGGRYHGHSVRGVIG